MSNHKHPNRDNRRHRKPRPESSGMVADARQQANAAHSRRGAAPADAQTRHDSAPASAPGDNPRWVQAAQATTRRRSDETPPTELLLPEGWPGQRPTLSDIAAGSDACARRGRLILDWIAAGFAVIDEADRSDSEPTTVSGCWEGAVVGVHRWAMHSVAAVIGHAADEAKAWDLALGQLPRSEAGMQPDSMRRVLACVCDHDECDDVAETLEMAWPIANATLEATAPDIGYIIPAKACTDYLASIGATDIVGHNSDSTVKQATYTRLGLDPDWRRHKPINTDDMVFDDTDTLLAVRPRRSSRSTRPDHDTLTEFLVQRPDGATTKEIADHYKISPQSARRSVDDLNPEFVYQRDQQRCVAHRHGRNAVTWHITSDRDEIDRRFSEHCQIGREYDVVYRTVSNGHEMIILDSEMIQRW